MNSIKDTIDMLTEEEKNLLRDIIDECLTREKELTRQQHRLESLNGIVSESLNRHIRALENLDNMTHKLENMVMDLREDEFTENGIDYSEFYH